MAVTSAPAPAVPDVRRLAAPRRARWWAAAVWAVATALLLVVLRLWVSHGGVTDLGGGAASALGAAGRLAGLLASYLMLAQVLGMARVPWVERSFGQDAVTRWHRWTGFTSFHLLLVHIVAILWSYTLLGRVSWVRETWDVVTTLPGMLLATVGFGLIVAVVVSSMRVARRRMRYEGWHLLHLYAYLGVGFALPHQLWTGTDLGGSTAATAFWWTLWAVTLLAVLVFRVGQPLWLSARHDLRVAEVVPEGEGLVSLHLTGRRLDELRVEPGQYFVWRFLSGTGWTRGHPLSLSAAPTTVGLRVTVGTRGDDGARVATLRRGTRVLVEGPYGRLTPAVRTRPRVAAFAAGSGIAPVMAMLHDNAWEPVTDTLVLRTSRPGEVPLAEDIEWLAGQTGLRFVALPGPRARTGPTWLPDGAWPGDGPSALRALVPVLDEHDVIVCGPLPWTQALVADLRAAGVPAEALHVERYDW
ncbi:ferredoxin reductase family protein [Cellulomonas alba]|uniref:Ferredoxin reductase family protein n=1 Tax=Cellulomonas alba TaxID=3053467 RepID=A0ABT7SBH1_9CELL|nr:ferredoxin reductase family protein [Cellulomonas alba]MDM7853530.1 ferredoxin reductase family protein [Cellulomonas alba]